MAARIRSTPDGSPIDRAEALMLATAYETARTEIAELLDLLTTVREALDVPHAATSGGAAVRADLVEHRCMYAVIALEAMTNPLTSPAREAAYLREQLATVPVTGYVTTAQLRAALAEGRNWAEVTAPADGT
ncbi:hypothetical protein FHS43_000537 [Streptosporangium becharense]|uniref:Uncharacterized protein n=1 Tax=Streptosporangium becharense TaxID=1816182 RepID=A0A7W9INX3_9ACTN|nr:hypothetical protein [Streptosporangium becharense]MBB2909291.1 hypothetical protein [Streptosporangium becharense]MBB5823806.1 hypothetical protein [Streptosporangium becharense]